MTIWLWGIHSSHNQFYRLIASCNSSIKTINVIVIVIITINVNINVNVNVIAVVIVMVNVMVIVIVIVILIIIGGNLDWRSTEGIRLPPMWSGFVSRRRHHMWVEFAVGSLVCSGYYGVPLSSKTNTSKFQFLLERTDSFQRVLKDSYALREQTNWNFQFLTDS